MTIRVLPRPIHPPAASDFVGQRSKWMESSLRSLLWVLLIGTLIPLVATSAFGEDAMPKENASESKPAPSSAIEEIDAFIADHSVNFGSKTWRNRLKKPPKLKFDPKKKYFWKLETNVGEIQFRLLTDVAPMHASSTIYLTRLGFYDSLKFHRVIKGFMAQGGDPNGNGRGGPGYKYGGEFSPTARHDSAGILSMANAGPNTDGSQFFITFKATPQLNNRHTVFGKAESKKSLATIAAMEALGRQRDPAPPTEPLFIKKATIIVK